MTIFQDAKNKNRIQFLHMNVIDNLIKQITTKNSQIMIIY